MATLYARGARIKAVEHFLASNLSLNFAKKLSPKISHKNVYGKKVVTTFFEKNVL